MNVNKIDIDVDYDRLRKEFRDMDVEQFLIKNNGQMMLQTMSNTPVEEQKLKGCLSLYYDFDNHHPKDPNTQPTIRDELLKQEDIGFALMLVFITLSLASDGISDIEPINGFVAALQIKTSIFPRSLLVLSTRFSSSDS